jgi:hypothetical protein
MNATTQRSNTMKAHGIIRMDQGGGYTLLAQTYKTRNEASKALKKIPSKNRARCFVIETANKAQYGY